MKLKLAKMIKKSWEFLKVNKSSTIEHIFTRKQLKIVQILIPFQDVSSLRNIIDSLRSWITHFMLLQLILLNIYESIKRLFEFLLVLNKIYQTFNDYYFWKWLKTFQLGHYCSYMQLKQLRIQHCCKDNVCFTVCIDRAELWLKLLNTYQPELHRLSYQLKPLFY